MANKYSLTLQLQLQSPQNVAQVVNQLQKQLGAVAVNVQVKNSAKATQQINQLTNATNDATNAAAKMGDAFGVSLKRFAAFSLASRAIGVFTRNLARAIDSAIEFQDGLVKISQITGQNLESLNGLTKEVTRLATTLGVASNEILGVTNILAQAGLKANDLTVAINALTKTKLAPTFGDINDTAEGAVALLAQFGQGVGALETQLGALNRVAADFAVESEDLIEVIRRTGGVFKASGGDLNELLALFTSVRATTRESAESIATALKTIFTRIQRPETIQYLRQFGIELVDLDGKFVGPYESVRRLSKELAGLGEGDIKFIEIAEQLGGYRQIGKVIPLLRQFETAERARQVALEAGNSLNEDAAKAQQSLAVQFQKTRENFLALIRGISETSSFQILVKTSLNLANALINVGEALKPIIPLITTLAAVKFAGNIGSFFGSVGAAFTRRQFGGPIQKFASGGLVPGSGNRDTVPAMLTPGEFVIRKSSVNKLGAGTLAAMNENRFNRGSSGRGIATDTRKYITKERGDKNFSYTGSLASGLIVRKGNLQDVKESRIALGSDKLGRSKGTLNKAALKKLQGKDNKDDYGGVFISPVDQADDLEGFIPAEKMISTLKSKYSDFKQKYENLSPDNQTNLKNNLEQISDFSVTVASLSKGRAGKIEDVIIGGIIDSINTGAKLLGRDIGARTTNSNLAGKLLRDINIDNIVGNIFEGMIANAGPPYTPEVDATGKQSSSATWDFPSGLGDVGKSFRGGSRLAKTITDAKTRFTSDNISRLFNKIKSAEEQKTLSLVDSLGGSLFQKNVDKDALKLPKEDASLIYKQSLIKKKFFDGAIQRFAVGSKGTGVKPLQGRKAYVFDFDDTLAETEARVGAEPNNPDKFSQFRGDTAAKLIDSGQATKIAAMARKRAQLGHDIYVLTARPGEPQTVDAINRFMQRVGAPAKGVIGVGNMFAGEREPGKRPGTTRLLTTGSKKAKILSQIAPNYDQTWFLDDAVENLISGKQVAGVKTVLADTKGKNIVKRFATGGAAPSDTVPALLTPGEFVFSKKAAQSIGYGALNRMNKHGVTGYAKGGPVAVQKFNGGGRPSASYGGGRGFNLLEDKASQLAVGFSLLSGTLGGTETAFQKVITTITTWGATLSSIVTVMNAFGVSLSLQKINISKIFGSGKGGLGDILGGYRRGGRRSGEGFREGFNNSIQLRERRRERAERLRRLTQQSQEPGFRGFSARADLARFRREPALPRLGQSATARFGQFLAQRQAAGGFVGRVAGIAGRGIGLAAAGSGGALAAIGTLAGPIGLAVGAFGLLNSVVGNLIGAETKYQKAVEKGSTAEAQKYAVLKEVPGVVSLFGQGLSEAYISATSWFSGKTVDSIKAQADAAAKAARFTNEFAENEKKASEVLQKAEAGTISFTQALNDRATLGNLENARSAQQATEKSIRERNKAERATVARDILTLGGILGQTSTQYNANLDKQNWDALNESIKKSKEEFDKLAPTIAKSNKEQFALGKTNEEIIKELEQKNVIPERLVGFQQIRLNQLQAKEDIRKAISDLEGPSGYKFRQGEFTSIPLFKAVLKTINPIQPGRAGGQYGAGPTPSKRKTEEEIQLEAQQKYEKIIERGSPALSEFIQELEKRKDLLTEQEKQEYEILKNIENTRKDLEENLKNQRKAYEENLRYLKTLSFGFSDVSARANAASVALQNFVDQSETGSIRTESSLKTLEAALSKSGQAISKEIFKTAQSDIRNALQQFGVDDQQLTRFDERTTALFTARKSLRSALELVKNQQGINVDTSPESIKKQLASFLEKDLKSSGIGDKISAEISKSLTSLNLEDGTLFSEIKDGNLDQLVEKALSPLEEAFIQQIKPIVDEYNQQQKILVDLTKQRIELEKSLTESAKRSIDIELESRKAIEEFGGPVVKTADKLDALNKKISQDLKLVGIRGVTGGSATEISRTQAEIQSRFRVLQSQQDAALKSGQGTAFGGIAGIDEDKRAQLRDAQESLIEYTRNRIDLIREEIDLVKKKNQLEKSAIDKLVSGDIEGFLKDQQASAAASVLRFGDQDLAKLFTPAALGAGLQSLQDQGLSDKEIERAYRTALMPVGGTERMAQVGAGTTPELEALKREGRDLASVLNETAQGIVEMDTMTVNAKTIQIMGAQDQLNQFRTNASAQAAIQQQPMVVPSTARSNVRGFNANAAATAINTGMTIAGGPLAGIATGNITNLTDSLNRFYESVNTLKDLKLTMKLDTTNVNVNFNGAGFLENLTNEVRTGVLKEVLNTIKREMRLDSEGRPTFPNI